MQPIGTRILEHAIVDSTNAVAAQGLEDGSLAHGDVVWALEQVAGRGRRGTAWHTEPGLDLACSVILKPENLQAADQFLLAKAVALAVHGVVARYLTAAGKAPERVRIKWPNDILVDRAKIAGMLVENELRGAVVATSIVGIGLNVNSAVFADALQATSLRNETGTRHGLPEVLQRVCAAMETEWQRMLHDPAALASAYSAQLWAKGRFTEFIRDGEPWQARALDVDAHGRLVVEGADGKVEALGLERLRYGPRN